MATCLRKRCACSLAAHGWGCSAHSGLFDGGSPAALLVLTICNAAMMKCSPTARGAALTSRHPSSTLDTLVCQALHWCRTHTSFLMRSSGHGG